MQSSLPLTCIVVIRPGATSTEMAMAGRAEIMAVMTEARVLDVEQEGTHV